MRSNFMRICFVSMFVFFSLFGTAYSFDKEEAALQWDAVRDTDKESIFLINLVMTERMPGVFPHTVKNRFYEIATPDDAIILLEKWINPHLGKQHPFAETLLRGLKGDEFTPLLEKYLYLASEISVQRGLYNLLTHQNSLPAYRAAIKYIIYVQEKGLHDQAIFYLQAARIFKAPEIRQEVINGVSSSSNITRAASYMALRNYPDDEVMAILDNALDTDTGIVPGEEDRFIPERHIRSGRAGKGLIKDIINTTKKFIKQDRLFNKNYQPEKNKTSFYSAEQVSLVSATSSDLELAEEFAPQILLSYGGDLGVDIKDANYLYIDYVPMYVNNVTKLDRETVYLNLENPVLYQGETYGPGNVSLGTLNHIGDPAFRSPVNYLDFSPAWIDFGLSIEDGYKALTVYPSVYFKVFKEPEKENPIAVQYWFFYYYNDWEEVDHPGDWETITVFLDADAQPVEAIFSTHYEANRYSWIKVETVNETHPKVYVANGGHGSYNRPGDTPYTPLKIYDYHEGDREVLSVSDYFLLDISVQEDTDDSWIRFEGRWGDENTAPNGPYLRTDTPSWLDWSMANHPPYNPDDNCAKRYGANIYGDEDNPGPWLWASGYGLDKPWTSAAACKGNHFASIVGAVHLLLLQPSSASASSSASEKIK